MSEYRNLPDAKKFDAIEYRLMVVQNAVTQSAIIAGILHDANGMHSSNESETLMGKLSMCGNVWTEAEGRGRYGSLAVQTTKNIFVVLLDVVHTLQPDMKKNIRLQCVVDFISDLKTELDKRTMKGKRQRKRRRDIAYIYTSRQNWGKCMMSWTIVE